MDRHTTRHWRSRVLSATAPARFGLRVLALTIVFVVLGSTSASAQYGQLSGLFVITSPDDPDVADFTGLGCAGGSEVVLYMPGITPTASDPTAGQSVPGRILAVTTAVSSPDPLLDGTFVFDDVRLPTNLQPGLYEVHARCGPVDLSVLVRLGINGIVVVQPDEADPDEILNPTDPLPATGRSSLRYVSVGVLLLGLGTLLVGTSQRDGEDSDVPTPV